MDPDFAQENEIWKLVLEKIATYSELDTDAWSMDDVMKASAAMSIRDDVQKVLMEDIGKEK